MDPTPYTPDVFHVPMPADFRDEEVADLLQRANSYAGTGEAIMNILLSTNQPVPQPTAYDLEVSRGTFSAMTGSALTQVRTTATTLHLTALLQEFDAGVVQDAQQIRNLCTNRLLVLATEGKTEASQLRAIEMLGKIRDVGLFEDRTVVEVHQLSTEQIQAALREKINRMRMLVSQPQDVSDVDAVPTKE